MNHGIDAARALPAFRLRGSVLISAVVVFGLAAQGLGAQATDQDERTPHSNPPPNSAVVFLCPSSPDSVANYRFLSALAELSSGSLRVVVKPTQIHGPSDLLLFEAGAATAAQGHGNQMLDLALSETSERSNPTFGRLAQSVRLNLQRFQRDLDQHTYLGLIEVDLLAAEGLGAGPTTTFMNGLRVNGRLTPDRLEAISSSFRLPLPPGSIGAAIDYDALTKGFARGDDNAKVTLEEYADFSCPECAELAPVLAELVESYGKTIKFIFRNFPSPRRKESFALHRIAVKASKLGKFGSCPKSVISVREGGAISHSSDRSLQ